MLKAVTFYVWFNQDIEETFRVPKYRLKKM